MSKPKIIVKDDSAYGVNDCWRWELYDGELMELSSEGDFDTRAEAIKDIELCKRLMSQAEIVVET